MFLEVVKEILSPNNLLMMNIGMAAGVTIGALPGLNVVFAVTVLLPLTFGMSSTAGILMLLGAYCGASYGGSITAILINTPGTPAAAATVFDGYPLARKGFAGDALKTALVCSVIGGIISAAALLFFAPQLAKVILHIGSPEYFALCLFGLFAAIGIAGKKIIKGVIMAFLGLLLSTVGADPFFGGKRFMFGNVKLLAGIKAAVVMLGVYAVAEVLANSKDAYSKADQKKETISYTKASIKIKDILKYWKTIIKSSIFGIIIGAVPGTGGAISAMFSYNEARRASKNPDEFGTGIIEGVVAPETGNNATTGATLIPALTLGIPGDACVAVLLGALTMQGITPGTELFQNGSTWVWVIMGGLILVNIFMFFQGMLFIRAFVNVTKVPLVVLLPCIMVITCMGSFAIGNSKLDVIIMVIAGLFGYIMKKFELPVAPLTIGMVLGYLSESSLRRSLTISEGSYAVFVSRPVSVVILAIATLSLFYPIIKDLLSKKKA